MFISDIQGRDRDPILVRLAVAANWDPGLSRNGLIILAHRQVSLKHRVARIARHNQSDMPG